MTTPTTRLLDRELMNLVERLSADFPDSSLGTITRVVESVAPPASSCALCDINAVVASVEVAARQSLTPLAWPAA